MHPILAGGLRGALNAHLGEAGTSNSDVSYAGADGSSQFSMQYYVDKATQFQAVLNALDAGAQAAQSALDSLRAAELAGDVVDDAAMVDLNDYLQQWADKRTEFRLTAEAINAGAAAINGLGGRFPVLSIPSGLGFVPIVMGAAAVAAIGAAAALIIWGNSWLKGLNARLALAQSVSMITDPATRDQFVVAQATAQAAVDAADDSPLTSIATIAKYVAIGAAIYFAVKAFD